VFSLMLAMHWPWRQSLKDRSRMVRNKRLLWGTATMGEIFSFWAGCSLSRPTGQCVHILAPLSPLFQPVCLQLLLVLWLRCVGLVRWQQQCVHRSNQDCSRPGQPAVAYSARILKAGWCWMDGAGFMRTCGTGWYLLCIGFSSGGVACVWALFCVTC